MKKIGEQIRYEQIRDFIDRDLEVLLKKPEKEKLDLLEGRFKDLQKSMGKIEQKLMADRRLNRSDVRAKVDNYRQESMELKRRFNEASLQFQRTQLFKKPQYRTDYSDNMRELEDLNERNRFIEKQFVETRGIVKLTKGAVGDQRQRIDALGHEWQQADAELTMIDQFMGMISNRNMLTKIILFLLAIFLALADISILVLKIL